MKIRSRRDNFFRVLIFGAIFICLAPMWFVYQRDGMTTEFLISSIVIMAMAGLLLWVWHHTYYNLNETHIVYHSGPFKGKIQIDKIQQITINKTSFIGLKFGLARNGMIIASSTHMDLYITPTQPQDFVKKLMEVNPEIEIAA